MSSNGSKAFRFSDIVHTELDVSSMVFIDMMFARIRQPSTGIMWNIVKSGHVEFEQQSGTHPFSSSAVPLEHRP